MVTWKWHHTVLVGPNTGHGMFSGTGFFTNDGQTYLFFQGNNDNGKTWYISKLKVEWKNNTPHLAKHCEHPSNCAIYHFPAK